GVIACDPSVERWQRTVHSVGAPGKQRKNARVIEDSAYRLQQTCAPSAPVMLGLVFVRSQFGERQHRTDTAQMSDRCALHRGSMQRGLARARAIAHLNGVPNVVWERHAWPAFSSSFSTAAAAPTRCPIICCCWTICGKSSASLEQKPAATAANAAPAPCWSTT